MAGIHFITTLILLAIISTSSSFDLNCKFESTNGYAVIGRVYICVSSGINVYTPESARVERMIGTHAGQMTNYVVDGFHANRQVMNYFPQGLDFFFPNLNSLAIWRCGMREIHQSDLKPFPRLRSLNMYDNRLQVLEEGLMDYNPNLEVVAFHGNRLVHIHPNIFDNLNKMTDLYLEGVPCIDKNTETREDSQACVQIMKTQCVNNEFMDIDKQVKNLINESEILSPEEFNDKLDKMNSVVSDYEFSNFRPLSDNIKNLRSLKMDSPAPQPIQENPEDEIPSAQDVNCCKEDPSSAPDIKPDNLGQDLLEDPANDPGVDTEAAAPSDYPDLGSKDATSTTEATTTSTEANKFKTEATTTPSASTETTKSINEAPMSTTEAPTSNNEAPTSKTEATTTPSSSTESPQTTTSITEQTTSSTESLSSTTEALTTETTASTSEAPKSTTETDSSTPATTEVTKSTTEASTTTTEASTTTTEASTTTTEASTTTTEASTTTKVASTTTTEASTSTTQASESTTSPASSTESPEAITEATSSTTEDITSTSTSTTEDPKPSTTESPDIPKNDQKPPQDTKLSQEINDILTDTLNNVNNLKMVQDATDEAINELKTAQDATKSHVEPIDEKVKAIENEVKEKFAALDKKLDSILRALRIGE